MGTMRYTLFQISVFALLSIGVVISIIWYIRCVRKQKRKVPPVLLFASTVALLLLFGLFCFSHPTYYQYNDVWIVGKHIRAVEEKYGTFNKGNIQEGVAGRVAYYLYKNNGPSCPITWNTIIIWNMMKTALSARFMMGHKQAVKQAY